MEKKDPLPYRELIKGNVFLYETRNSSLSQMTMLCKSRRQYSVQSGCEISNPSTAHLEEVSPIAICLFSVWALVKQIHREGIVTAVLPPSFLVPLAEGDREF